MRDHHRRIKKREMKSPVDDETPSVCTEHAKRETFLRLSTVARGIKTEKTRRCRPPRERREYITAALFKRTV